MTAQKKPVSEHAQCAKLCKAFVKKMGLECSTSSDIFSGGTSVRVVVYDADMTARKKIDSELNKYQYGHFDGMLDIYESSNARADIPQVKYLFIDYKYGEEIRQKAYEWAVSNFADSGDDLPALLSDVGTNDKLGGEFCSTVIHQVLNGHKKAHDGEKFVTFWDCFSASSVAASIQNSAPLVAVAGDIVGVYHTKMNCDIFIVTIPEKLQRADFDALLEKARKLGGWYSRKWGDSPNGFAFKTQDAAESFTAERQSSPQPAAETVDPVIDQHNANQAAKLRKIAESARNESAQKLAARDTNTQKKLCQAMHAKIEGYRLERVANVAEKLSGMWEGGTIAKSLRGFVSKKSLFDALIAETEQVPNGFHAYSVETGRPHKLANLELWELCENKRDEKALKIQEIENKIKFSNIAGFFPTPKSVCKVIYDHIRQSIKSMQSPRVLEPNSGSGNLCEFARDSLQDPKITAFEFNSSLAELTRLKGFDCTRDDFLELSANPAFDLVLMNPPFEKMDDIDHVMHAHKFLNEGGQLLSIMSASFTFNQTKKAQSFRDWLTANDGHWIELPQGSFKESGTMVNTVLVVVNGGHHA